MYHLILWIEVDYAQIIRGNQSCYFNRQETVVSFVCFLTLQIWEKCSQKVFCLSFVLQSWSACGKCKSKMARGRSSVGKDKEKEKEKDSDRQPDPKYALWIIAAIGKVKGQKQRPSEDRIAHILENVYGLEQQEALEQLELCVKTGRVLKVVFKNKASYKDPAKVPAHMRGIVEKPTDLQGFIKEALENIGDENGCTQQAIHNYIVDHHAASLESTGNARIKESLKKGLASGVFIKEGRYYRLATPPKV